MVLLAAPWALAWLSLLRLARRTPRLDQIEPLLAGGPLVTVVIPARNEAHIIETVVRSVMATRYPDVEILVVDDRSTDATAAKVTALATEDPRVRLLSGEALPAGWFGKPWACVQGYRAAQGAALLFTDADTRHDPMLLPHAMGALTAGKGQLVTVVPFQRCGSFWERVVMPQVWLLLGLRFHPRVVNRGRHARDVIANGQFILISRDDYEAAGTHAAVRNAVAEDLALAQRTRATGRHVWFAFALTLMETRMYHGFRHLVEGWSKNIFLGGRQSFPDEPLLRSLVPILLAAWLCFWLLPPVALLATASHTTLHAAALVATALSAVYWTGLSIGMGLAPWYGLLYPLGAIVTLGIVLRSTWRGERRVVWKDRTYGRDAASS